MELIFDLKKYRSLKRKYAKALEEKKDVFLFEGQELVTSYAKYLLEFLKPQFDESKNKK